MNAEITTMLEILKAALWETELNLPAEVDWQAVCQEMKAQTVLALPADLLEEMELPQDIGEKWNHSVWSRGVHSFKIMSLQNELHELFTKHGIEYVVLKGMAAACYYPHPEYREFGDIDILVKTDSYEEACKLLHDNGYGKYSECTKHVTFEKNSIRIDIHFRFSANAVEKTDRIIDECIFKGFSQRDYKNIDGCCFYMLPSVQNGLVLLQHIKGHLREEGLGLRQVIDWMMYVGQELNDSVWENEFQSIVKAVGLEELALTITRICQMYLGLSDKISWCKAAREDLCQDLMNEFIECGDFGGKSKQVKVTSTLVTLKRKGFFRELQRRGIINWKLCQKHRWLKPFAWLHQIVRLMGQSKGMSILRLKKGIGNVTRKEELLNRLGLK